MELSNEQWQLIRPCLTIPSRRPDGLGRPRCSDRACFEALIWLLETGSAWNKLPAKFPPRSSVFARFKQWSADGSLKKAFAHILRAEEKAGRVNTRESFIDGSLIPAKKKRKMSVRAGVALALA